MEIKTVNELILKEMNELVRDSKVDAEVAHVKADNLLVEYAKLLGADSRILEAGDKVHKWYA